MPTTFARRAALALALASTGFAAQAQDVIKIAGVYELSGAGASAGTYFKDGVELAVKEINAAGGILGKKIVSTVADTQTQPGVAKGLAAKAADDGAFAVFGPVFSGSIRERRRSRTGPAARPRRSRSRATPMCSAPRSARPARSRSWPSTSRARPRRWR